MLQLLVSPSEIRKAEAQLRRKFIEQLTESKRYLIGFPGGSFNIQVRTARNDAIWYATFLTDEKDRWINLYGFKDRLRENISNNIVVECNPPAGGIDRRSAGLFLREPNSGEIFFAHRGRIGGGKKGVGKSTFKDWYRGNWQPFLDDETGGKYVSEALVISNINDGSNLVSRMEDFVRSIDDFKRNLLAPGPHDDPDSETASVETYSDEFFGTKIIPARDAIVAACDHGFVVRALARWISSNFPDAKIGNRGNIDLFATVGRRRILAEIKTDGSTTSIHTGIGQLMVYGLNISPTERWLVLPDESIERWNSALKKLGIRAVGFSGVGKNIAIKDKLGP